ncbi:hypothetical protein SLEP1_g14942 [Rubroshorea leprosula]|uniref:Uncharacterized protein n=1 Tax=Rubroshorea leprosula TaxID=152421 RepID=A0AAV5IRN6_9ROSI|nr:hypothetical protein SLEP1_g14942 [Rubroshorea leprosula]
MQKQSSLPTFSSAKSNSGFYSWNLEWSSKRERETWNLVWSSISNNKEYHPM